MPGTDTYPRVSQLAQGGSGFEYPELDAGHLMEQALMQKVGIGADIRYNEWASSGLCFTIGKSWLEYGVDLYVSEQQR